MEEILRKYVQEFNEHDNEYYKQLVSNDCAEKWMQENIPLIEIPDKTIEKIYYFRWWVFRKHIKSTEDGYIITEFLPPVPWGGKHNSIIAAAGHHIAEAKWLKCGKTLIEDYVKFWLEEKSLTYLYSSWIIYAMYEYCRHINDFSFGKENLELLMNFYEKTEKEHMTESGLMWSIDGHDAMECSISGTDVTLKRQKGLRPTLNSYMAANAYAISEFAEKSGKKDIAEKYREKYKNLKEKITAVLWDGDFYKAIHSGDFETTSISDVVPEQNVKELIGYIPWCFNLAPEGFEKAFEELKLEDGFNSEFGLTTAEKRHPRYLYEVEHECLWNGYIWPFATSQVLYAVKNLIDNYSQKVMDKDDFYAILRKYAECHYLEKPDGTKVCWIDEVKDPGKNEWSSRAILEKAGWLKEKGGLERGKDYNHSTFCDIVLGGLLGIKSENGEVTVNPRIPDDWDYFKVENLRIAGKCYRIVYDKGDITIEKEN